MLAFLAHPDVLKKAQQEIDAVLGRGHLPDLDDEPSLPYVTAVVKETLRWREVAPMGDSFCKSHEVEWLLIEYSTAIPHLLNIEDIYKGYRLPAGSIVIANAWLELFCSDHCFAC